MDKVIVTGGSGFIGSNLVDRLVEEGYRVVVFDNQSSESNDKFYKNDSPNVSYHKVDIADYDSVRSLFNGVKYVFHLAAESRIGPCIENPLLAVRTNVTGTSVLLQCAREANVERFVFSSTSAIYGLQQAPHTEGLRESCLNPYSSTKYCAEQMCKVYYKLYGLKTVILRYFNVFGNREPTKGQFAPVTARFMLQKAAGQSLTVVGDGSQKRDFVHVSDVVEMNILAATKDTDKYGEIYNVGTGKNYTVIELAKMISNTITFLDPRPGEAVETRADISKTQSTYGWAPKIRLDEWLRKKLAE